MKLVAILFAAFGSLLVTESALAQISIEKKPEGAQFVLACSDEKPSVGFVVRELTDAPETIVAELFLFQGAQYIPVDTYPRANNLEELKKRAELLSKLPTYLRIEWPRTDCVDKGPFLISCEGQTATTNYEGVSVKAWKMNTVLSLEATTKEQTMSVKVNLSLNVNGEDVVVPLYYTDGSCTSDYIF